MERMRSFCAAAAVAGVLLAAAALPACSGRGAAEILETAELEEKQNAPEHARKLYQEIVDKYPGTPEASQAAARLKALAATQ